MKLTSDDLPRDLWDIPIKLDPSGSFA